MDIVRWTVILFALRVPLLCALALAALAPLGAFSFSPFGAMLQGLFDLNAWGAFWVGLFSWLSAAACWICSLLILNYGPRRIPGMRRVATDLEFRPFPWLAAGYGLSPLTLLAGVLSVSTGLWAVALGSATGFGASVAACRLLSSLHLRPGKSSSFMSADPIGYIDQTTGRLLPGHWIAIQFTGLFLSGWSSIGLLTYCSLTTGINVVMLPPSLAFVAILIGAFALVLSGFAFFFDRYRIPVLLPSIALLAAASAIPGSDQFAGTFPRQLKPLPKPAEILSRIQAPIVVCASGGGIAASAWTAEVLAALDCRNSRRFLASLALFSGASGGSVGGMHFLAACRSGDGCGAAFERASRSSLDAVAWGLAGPDLLRAAVPFAGAWLGEVGRGWALEQAWDPGHELRTPLSAWPGGPAIAFNATIVETGEGLSLANVDLAAASAGVRSVDPSLVSAARLSASFPFVTPTPKIPSLGYHLADGGYYDIYGVGAAVMFLQQAYFAANRSLPVRILMIEIRTNRTHPRPAPAQLPTPMLFQWWSPIQTMLNVRDTAQRDRNDTTLELLGLALAARGVSLERVAFEIPRDDVPLS